MSNRMMADICAEPTNKVLDSGYDLEVCLQAMDQSLISRHPSMRSDTNPVLHNILLGLTNKQKQEKILEQYCILPAEIVNLLSMALDRLRLWTSIESELTRNINEEKGSRTGGIAHYQILIKVIYEELGLTVDQAEQLPCTIQFLHSLKQALSDSTRSCVTGSVYALENSAIPELVIVAEVINHYALSIGYANPVIKLPAQRISKQDFNFNLNAFFAMHLLDFEVGHKNGLAEAIKIQQGIEPLDLDQFNYGFEFVLIQMDKWWQELADLGN